MQFLMTRAADGSLFCSVRLQPTEPREIDERGKPGHAISLGVARRSQSTSPLHLVPLACVRLGTRVMPEQDQ